MKTLKYFADNQFLDSVTYKFYEVYNPSTGEHVANMPRLNLDEVKKVIASAKAAYAVWSDTPITKRMQVMFKVKQLLDEHLDELTHLVAYEHGKAWTEARGDALKAIEGTENALTAPAIMMGESLMNISKGYDTVTYREPVGVFAGICPFNFPAMIPMGWMMPMCIATGNTLVLKAASMTPMITGMSTTTKGPLSRYIGSRFIMLISRATRPANGLPARMRLAMNASAPARVSFLTWASLKPTRLRT